MKNEVTEKLELFLKNLRCEDAERETLVHLDSCREETERLAGLEEEYTQVMDGLDQRSRAILENYIKQILSKAFAEQQEAFAGTLGCYSDFVRSGDSFNQSK